MNTTIPANDTAITAHGHTAACPCPDCASCVACGAEPQCGSEGLCFACKADVEAWIDERRAMFEGWDGERF